MTEKTTTGYRRHIECIEICIESRYCQEEYDGYKALHYACEKGNDVLIEMLIQLGADVKSVDNCCNTYT